MSASGQQASFTSGLQMLRMFGINDIMDVNIFNTAAVREVPVYLRKCARLMRPAFGWLNLEPQRAIRL